MITQETLFNWSFWFV